MPIKLFGSTSGKSPNTLDTSQFVQKPYLRINYIESNIEEDIDIRNQFKFKNLILLHDIEAASKAYVDNKFNDPSIKKHRTCRYQR